MQIRTPTTGQFFEGSAPGDVPVWNGVEWIASPAPGLGGLGRLVFQAAAELVADFSVAGGNPMTSLISIAVPSIAPNQVLRAAACVVCSHDTPPGETFFQIAINGIPASRELGEINAGGLALEWFGPLVAPPAPPFPVDLVWRATAPGNGRIRAAGPTDGEGCSFSVAIWERI